MRERVALFGGDLSAPTTGGRLRRSRPHPLGGRRISIRVLGVDDQELVLAGFTLILDHQPDLEVVGEAGNGAKAVERARLTQPDVMVLDLGRPTMARR